MKKKALALASLAAVMTLTACGPLDSLVEDEKAKETKQTQDVDKKSEDKKSEDKKVSKEEKGKSGKDIEAKEVIYDKDGVTITFLGAEFVEDSFGDEMNFLFDVENTLTRNIEVQAENVSVDGRMVNEMNVTMSDSIAAGKVGTATLSFGDYDGKGLPEFNETLELNLQLFDWDDWDFEVEVPVKVNLK